MNTDIAIIAWFIGLISALGLLALLLYLAATADWALKGIDRSFLRLVEKCKGRKKGGRRHSLTHLLH